MTTTLPPTVEKRLDQLTDPAADLLDQAESMLETIATALEHLVPRKNKAAQEMDPMGWAESAVSELGDLLGELREHLAVAP